MKHTSTIFLFIVSTSIAQSQQYKNSIAAPYIGLNAYTSGANNALVQHSNIAAIAFTTSSNVAVYTEQRFGLAQLRNVNMAVALKAKNAGYGIQANSFGTSGFTENNIGISYARLLGSKVALGAKVNYYNQNIAGYGNSSAITAEAGLLLQLTPKLTSGVSVYNPTSTVFGASKTEKLVSIYKFGLGYTVSTKVNIVAEAVQQQGLPAYVIAAVHYQFEKNFFAKVGLSTAANNFFVAAGVLVNNQFSLHITASHHQQLGISPGVMLQYSFAKNKAN